MTFIVLLIAGCIAWFISTVAAGGAAMLMIPLVSLLIGPQVVAPVISLGAFLANPSRAWLFRGHIDWTVSRWLIPGSLLGAVLGSWAFTQISGQWIQVVLGLFLISTIFQYQFGKSKCSFLMKKCWFFPVGVIISFLSAIIGGTGPVHNPFMLNYGLEKERLVATKAINSLVMQLTKLISYTGFGVMTLEIGGYGLIIGIGGLIGAWLASRHLKKIDPSRFRSYTLILMPICGVLLLIKALS
ncbi:MAG: sulfite exporter TauE/SafE family protein [Porticoccus sp.]|nr:sulfite exporter TauE/SafE family protein [Porticoccus sp.]